MGKNVGLANFFVRSFMNYPLTVRMASLNGPFKFHFEFQVPSLDLRENDFPCRCSKLGPLK